MQVRPSLQAAIIKLCRSVSGAVFFPPSISFSPCENPGVPVSASAKLLPSSKIATINQKVLKEATSNFMDDFFQLLQHYSHQLHALLRHPPALHNHPPTPSSVQPAPL